MPTMTVHMFGLMHFNVCSTDAPRALLPNGTRGEGGIPPHFASLFVERERCHDFQWWDGHVRLRHLSILNLKKVQVPVPVLEFRVPAPAEITFPEGDGRRVEVVNLDEGLPMLRKIDPQFVLDRTNPDTIAQVPIRGGRLETSTLNGGVNIVQWTINTDGALKIEARLDTAPDVVKRIWLNPQNGPLGTEVIMANAPDLLARVSPHDVMETASRRPHAAHAPDSHDHGGHGHPGAESHHFKLYGRLEQNRNDTRLALPLDRRNAPHGHAYFKALGNMKIENSCTATCCD